MKCIKAIITTPFHKVGDIMRVTDERAMTLVYDQCAWIYVPKHEWKAQKDAK